ncbi:MAG: GTP cyclohydrolase [Cryomorphaceae bacterium BACL23 MAG-120924-bin60]|nr:MAG: GTP cyclohydrolase [Cryomorphaceae bacterium BACL23 MAG-120924-bin60]
MSPAISSPLHANAFLLSDDEKVVLIAEKFAEIMEIMGLDLKDDSLSGTPERVAKMYIHETFQGLNPLNKPDITLFENNYAYGEMLVERNITLHSTCEHHFVPILGVCHVAYFATGKVVGLSKLNRIVKYYAKRPQVQERLTEQIAAELKRSLQTEDVAVYIDAEHLCVKTRGIEDCASSTVTSHYSGRFKDAGVRSEFLSAIRS